MSNTRIYSVRKYAHQAPFIVMDEDEAQAYIDAGYFVNESVLNYETPLLAEIILYASVCVICWIVSYYLFGMLATNLTFATFGLVFAICWYRSARA